VLTLSDRPPVEDYRRLGKTDAEAPNEENRQGCIPDCMIRSL